MKHPSLTAALGVPLLAAAVLAAATAPSSGLAAAGDADFTASGLFRAAPVNIIQGFATADFDGDGHLDVASSGVFSADIDDTLPRALPVQLGDGAGHLGPAVLTTFPSNTGIEGPLAVAARDIDGDGVADIATATLDLVQSGVPATVVYRLRVLLGQGDGSFTVLKGFTLPGEVTEVVLADLTGDGDVDLAYATDAPEGETVWTAEGRGDGTFARPEAVTATQQFGGITGLDAVDVDGDGRLDLVYGQGCVIVLLNTGDGFASPICNPLELAPYALEVTDLNEDGIPDVAFGDASGGHIRVALGDGAGHFTTAHTYSQIAGQVLSVVATDVDGDGHRDLLASGDFSFAGSQTGFAVLRGDGTGGFRLASRWVAGGSSLTIGDFTEDGRPDVVSEDAGGHDAAFLTVNAGGGHFRTAQLTVATARKAAGQIGSDVQSADVDNDGRDDVVLLAGTAVIVYLNRGGGAYVRWSAPVISFGSDRILSAALGDLDGDGNLDVALGTLPDRNVAVLLGRGDGSFAKAVTYGNGSGAAALSIDVGDVTGDGNLDIVTNTFTSLSVLPGKGDGTFGAAKLSGSAQANQTVLHLVDLDDDGDLDSVGAAKTGTADNASTQVTTALNNGSGQFGNVATRTIATNLTDGLVADVTGDGRPDLALAGARATHSGTTGIFILPGNAGGLAAPIVDETEQTPTAITAADYDRDGSIDVATTFLIDVGVFTNPGDGHFAAQPSVLVTTPFDNVALASARYTGDRKADIVAFQASNPPAFTLHVNSTKG